jgi:hypothetical protein
VVVVVGMDYKYTLLRQCDVLVDVVVLLDGDMMMIYGVRAGQDRGR